MAHKPTARRSTPLTLLAVLMLLVGCQSVFPTALPSPTIGVQQPIPTIQPTPATTQLPIDEIIASLQGLPIGQFFEASYHELLFRDPDKLFVNGLAEQFDVPGDQFTDRSDAYIRDTQQLEVVIWNLLNTYDHTSLTQEQQLSYDIYAWYLDDRIRGQEFMYNDYPVNPLTIWGIQNWLIDFMVNYLPLETEQDAQNYISRLSQLDTWVDQILEGLKLREQAGVVPPRSIIQDAITQLEAHIQMEPQGSFNVDGIELYTSFVSRLEDAEGINAQDKPALILAARTEIEQTFVPAFLKLGEYLLYLKSIAMDDLGVWKFPNGEAYYAYLLRQQTSTDMTPDEIHELGLAEVERILAEIRQVAVELGYPPDVSLAELNPEVDSLAGDALLAEFQRLIEAMELKVGDFFNLYPSTGLVILPEPYGSLSYYIPPPLDGSGPGKFFVSMDQPLSSDIIPSFIYHETIPGHHLQGALTREMNLPTFQKNIEFNAYLEGWASYAERLAWEMGVYENDPYGNLGRLSFELSRAIRLVVDTGIHARGWTADQALDYLEGIYGVRSSPSALTRYIVLPGQACGYTIGMHKILELRQSAMDQLGSQFDIKEFHDIVLGNGPMPLDILENVVNEWIEDKLFVQGSQ